MVLLLGTPRVCFLSGVSDSFYQINFCLLDLKKNPTSQTREMCRRFVRVFFQVSDKQKRSSPCLLLAAVQSLVHSWETEETCQVHCVAGWESLSCRRDKKMESPAEEKGRQLEKNHTEQERFVFPAFPNRCQEGVGGKRQIRNGREDSRLPSVYRKHSLSTRISWSTTTSHSKAPTKNGVSLCKGDSRSC